MELFPRMMHIHLGFQNSWLYLDYNYNYKRYSDIIHYLYKIWKCFKAFEIAVHYLWGECLDDKCGHKSEISTLPGSGNSHPQR